LAGVFTGYKIPVDTVTASILTEGVPQLPDLNDLSHAEKDALIRARWQRLEAAERIEQLPGGETRTSRSAGTGPAMPATPAQRDTKI
jgi:hypothetical protein